MKILFIYPNHGSELRVPLAISILISVLRKANHEVKLFDTTFLGAFSSDNDAMARLGTHQTTNLNDLVGETKKVNPKEELKKVIDSFKPDFICVSLVERNFNEAKELLKDVSMPVLAGGILPTVAPEFLLDEDWIDDICIGEGEKAILDHRTHPLINLDEVPEQSWSDFDERHLLKPFMGKVYRGGAFEFSRGCLKACTFCVAPKLREIQKGLGRYHRTKSPALLIHEIKHKMEEYKLEMIAFSDTDFLTAPKHKLTEFLEMYHDHINLPFTIQASVRTLLDEEILKLLREANCCAISVGVESGSYRIQKNILKKILPLELVKKAFDLCRKHELRVTANYMIGLPTETEYDIALTMAFNRVIDPPSIAVTFFTPFMGTELYNMCIKEGFYKAFKENVYAYPPLEMPQLSQNRIKELVKEFVDDFKDYQEDFNILEENHA